MRSKRYALWQLGLAMVCSAVLFQNCKGELAPVRDSSRSVLGIPEPTISKRPLRLEASSDATIEFAVTEEPETLYECSLDFSEWRECTSPLELTDLIDGVHVLKIQATSPDGKISTSEISWTVDATPPELVVNSSPAQETNQTNVQIEFTATDSLSGFDSYECSFQRADFSACDSPLAFEALEPGPYNLLVRARDVAGSWSEPSTIDWRVDLSAPSASITEHPESITAESQGQVVFSGTDPDSSSLSFECALNEEPFRQCTSPENFNVDVDGTHSFQVRAKDLSGNQSETTSYSWVLDTTPPELQLVSGPSDTTSNRSAHLIFEVTDSGSGVARTECTLNQVPHECESEVLLADLDLGAQEFSLTAIDNAGNRETVTTEWTITLPPSQCNDGIDNDGDGLSDYPADPGCVSPNDNTEYSPPLPVSQCNDGLDNDFDGAIDYPEDSGCTSPQDDTEKNLIPECRDGVDNDGDGALDYPDDPGCRHADDDREVDPVFECSDGIDNDGDGATDFPEDPDCISPHIGREHPTCPSDPTEVSLDLEGLSYGSSPQYVVMNSHVGYRDLIKWPNIDFESPETLSSVSQLRLRPEGFTRLTANLANGTQKTWNFYIEGSDFIIPDLTLELASPTALEKSQSYRLEVLFDPAIHLIPQEATTPYNNSRCLLKNTLPARIIPGPAPIAGTSTENGCAIENVEKIMMNIGSVFGSAEVPAVATFTPGTALSRDLGQRDILKYPEFMVIPRADQQVNHLRVLLNGSGNHFLFENGTSKIYWSFRQSLGMTTLPTKLLEPIAVEKDKLYLLKYHLDPLQNFVLDPLRPGQCFINPDIPVDVSLTPYTP